MGSLFKAPSPKVTQIKNPFEENVNEQITQTSTDDRNLIENLVRDIGSTGTEVSTLTDETTDTTRTGLGDTSLLAPLKTALGGINLGGGEGADTIQALINERFNAGTPQGYAESRRKAIEDYSDIRSKFGHSLASAGRGGDAKDRALRIADEALSRSLLSGFDASQKEREGSIVNLLGAKNDIEFDKAGKYANILRTTPFETVDTSTGVRTGERDVTETEDTTDTLNRNISETIRRELEKLGLSEKSGFGTQTHVQEQSSPLSQLVGLGTAIAGLGTGGGATVGGLALQKLFGGAGAGG